MRYQIMIDGAGRLVIPKPVRQQLNLGPGMMLDLEVEAGHMVLRPPQEGSALVLEDGLLFLGGSLLDPRVDLEAVRQARIARVLNPDAEH